MKLFNTRFCLDILSIFGLYFFFVKLSDLFADTFANQEMIWFPSGFALAYMLIRGASSAVLIVCSAFVTHIVSGADIMPSIFRALGNTLEPLLGLALLRRINFDPRLVDIKSYYLLLIFGAGVASICAASLTILIWIVLNGLTLEEYGAWASSTWLSHTLGTMLLTPLILIFYYQRHGFTLKQRKLEFVLFLLSTLILERLSAFSLTQHWQTTQFESFWMFLLMIFTALRLGRHGVSIGLLIIVLSCGLRVESHHPIDLSYLDFWLHHMALVICSMTLAIALYEQRFTEKKFDSEAIKYKTLVNMLPDMVWLKDPQLNYLACNQAFELFLQNSCDNIIGKNDHALFERWLADHYRESDQRTLTMREPLFLQERVQHGEQGDERHLEVVKTPIFGTDGKLISLLGVARDVTDFVNTSNELKASEARAHAIIEATPVPMALSGDRGRILYVNPAFKRTFGYDLSDVQTLDDWWIRTIPDEVKRQETIGKWHALFSQADLGRSDAIDREISIQDNSSAMHQVLLTVSRVNRNDCLMVLFDITEHKRLRKNNSRFYRSIAASINEIYIFDAESLRFSFVNAGALANLGYSMTELKKITPLDIKPAYSLTDFNRLVEPLKRHEKPGQLFETVHQRKDGSLYDVEVHLQLFEPIDEPPYFLAIVLDITEMKQLEAKMSTLVDAVNAIIWSIDADLRIDYVSQQALQILGFDTTAIIGKPIISVLESDRFHEAERPVLLKAFQELLEKHVPIKNLEHRIKDANDQWKWMAVSMTPILDANHALQKIVGVVHDLSLQKRAEEQLRSLNSELDRRVRQEVFANRKKDLLLQQQNRMAALGEMIGNIAHQWRQPLNALAIILMDLEDAFAHGEATTESIRHSIDRSNELLSKMSSTIDDFRNFFKNDKTLEKTEISQVVTETLGLLEATLTLSHIQLHVTEKIPGITGYIHAGELSQAILCLINNAKDQIVKKQMVQGLIYVEIDTDDNWCIIRVEDNGGGIAEHDWPKLFDPYFTTKPQGSGLGLYITKLTVEQSMHGRVLVENTDLGARFSLFLPKHPNMELFRWTEPNNP
ncbi:MAG: hypothetical protein CVV06_09950 [Gammaproteobacteria bacterium HGW-Gammaproteobacteria-10]|nr:MAG: hypothetical protein CVV06_09950 [Gammaproteobacteria bacterium HGW-Gammaproteobacteria-10]